MSIIQISKIQQRSGNLVDLPQLDEAELGFASDAKKLFVGKTTGDIENVEVLTAYSDIAFSQIDGAVGNLDINTDVANGEVLTFNGVDWTNRGGNTGGYINLGNVSNVALLGGGAGYQLTTNGYGDLSWEPKGFVTLPIVNVTNANPAVVEFSKFFPLAEGTQVTINNIQGNTAFTVMNASIFYLKVIANTSTEYQLYTDSGLTTAYDTSAFANTYPYTAATNASTGVGGNLVTVANSYVFTANVPVMFQGNVANSGIIENYQYYVTGIPDGTHIQISTSNDGNSSNIVVLTNSSMTANAFVSSGVASIAIGSSGTSAGGANTQVQFNNLGLLAGDANFAYNSSNKTLTVDSVQVINANVTANANIANTITRVITTGSAATTGNITGTWTLTSGSTLQSTYADLAEYYAADNSYASGTVLEFGGSEEVTLAGAESNKLAGVVSENPAYVLNSNIQVIFPVMVALIGRTPVQVIGTVNKGDMLVSAGNGYAKVSSDPKLGTVIGKAITNKTSEEPGLVEVMVGRL